MNDQLLRKVAPKLYPAGSQQRLNLGGSGDVNKRQRVLLGGVSLAAAAAVACTGALLDGEFNSADMRSFGLAAVIGCVTWMAATRARHDEIAIFKAGQKIGYDDGWADARRTIRPSLVVSLDDRRPVKADTA